MSTLVAQTISNGTVSTSSANVIQGSAKAWVNFNGTNASIRGSYNVSSVTRNGTGDYTVNYTNAMPNTNYCVTTSGTFADEALCAVSGFKNGASASFVRLYAKFSQFGSADPVYVCVSVFS
jgi:hypothetical protein